LAANVTATGSDITFDQQVVADGSGDQKFDAGSGVLWAKDTITKTGSGRLTLSGDTLVDLDGTVDVQTTGGSLLILDDFSAGGDLLATENIIFAGSIVNGILDGGGDQLIDARYGTLLASGSLQKVTNGDLILHGGSEGLAVDLADTVGTSSGSLYITANQGDIQVSGDLAANSGGTLITAGAGSIYTNDGSGALNVAISGSSNDNVDGSGSTGAQLPYGGKAAIVIVTKDDLTIGTNVTLTAQGKYDSSITDDRAGVLFKDSGEYGGEPVDIAIYLASKNADVHIAAQQVSVAPAGAMVVDAYDTVTLGTEFVDSLGDGGVSWLELCSRITTSLADATDTGALPYADDPATFEDWIGGSYILRGIFPNNAWVLPEEDIPLPTLISAEASATATPASPELGDIGQIEGAHFADLQWLAQELGLCQGDQQDEEDTRCQEMAQAYLAGAFLQATDLRPNNAASSLRVLAETLHDSTGTHAAALLRVVDEFVPADVPPSEEQMAAIASAFELHTDDGTHYAAAGQWLDALSEYIDILNTDIGWSIDESVVFVMGKYCASITDAADVSVTAFIQMHLEGLSG